MAATDDPAATDEPVATEDVFALLRFRPCGQCLAFGLSYSACYSPMNGVCLSHIGFSPRSVTNLHEYKDGGATECITEESALDVFGRLLKVFASGEPFKIGLLNRIYRRSDTERLCT